MLTILDLKDVYMTVYLSAGVAGQITTMTNPLVARIERVTHCYGHRLALNDVTLDIPARCMAD